MGDNPAHVQGKKCVFRKNTKYPEKIAHVSKSKVSIMFSGTACGKILTPYVVYKAKGAVRPTWQNNRAIYNTSESGWFNGNLFEDYFIPVILPRARKLMGNKVAIGDNLSSHFSKKIISLCDNNNIAFVPLMANQTHVLQPLDVAFFKPLKDIWGKVIAHRNAESLRLRKNIIFTNAKFPGLLSKLLDEMNSSNIKAGFAKCGLFPYNPEKVYERLPDYDKVSHEPANADLQSDLVKYLKEARTLPKSTPRKKR